MLKSKIGYSMDIDSFKSGETTAKMAVKGMKPKLGFLFSSCVSDVKKVVEGVKSVTNTPVIGCTSAGALIIPEGIVASPDGFSGMMTLDDPNMSVTVASHTAGKNARLIGRKVAIEAVEKYGKPEVPAYFYMVASPKEEEDYLMGIQDIIGRVPMFGGSAADDAVEGKWKIICEDKVFSDGVAVAFFYTDNDIKTAYTGAYRETRKCGVITKVIDDRTLVSIDGEPSLKKYGEWIRKDHNELRGTNLLVSSIRKPLGVKDPTGNITAIRHPMIGNSNNTMNIGNKLAEKTVVIQMEATTDELIEATGETLKQVKKSLLTEPAAYVLVHCGGRKLGIGKRLDEVHKELLKASKGIPFITVFTFGEYGYNEHSGNTCGGLMLSFTAFGKE